MQALKINIDFFNQYYKYIFMILILYITDSGLITYGGDASYYLKNITLILLSVVALFWVILTKKKIDKNHVIALFIVMIIIVFSGIISQSSFAVLVAFICILSFAFIFVNYYKYEEFREIYLNTIIFIATFSLIVFFILLIFPDLYQVLPTSSYVDPGNSVVTKYIELFFTHSPVLNYNLPRNFGPFWEPGVYQIYLNIALIMLFQSTNRKYQVVEMIILITAIITTVSTTAFIALIPVILYYFINGQGQLKNKKVIVLFAILLLTSIASIFFSDIVFNSVFKKIVIRNNSFDSRTGSLEGNLVIIANYPVLGAGYANTATALQSVMPSELVTGYLHQTNTFTNYLASFGLFAGMYFIYGWLKFAFCKEKNIISGALIFIILLILTSGENMIASLFMNILLFYGITDKKNLFYKGNAS